MKHHIYTAKVDDAARKELIEDINALAVKLQPLVEIAESEKSRMAKMGNKTRSFVTDAITLAEKNPEILPRMQEPERLREKLDTVDNLRDVHQSLASLSEKLRDTVTVAGAELYEDARLVYAIMKTNARPTGLQGARDALKKRFARKNRAPVEELSGSVSATGGQN